MKYSYCLGSYAYLISALFAVLLNVASEGIGRLCCTGVDLRKPPRPHLVQVSKVAVSLLVTARDQHHSVHLWDQTGWGTVPKMTQSSSCLSLASD